jgi:ubiquinone biosynthesis monooxygenase Coq7
MHGPKTPFSPVPRGRLERLAGWITGALPAAFGAPAVYRAVDAVESFVDGHYGAQIERLQGQGAYARLGAVLAHCRADEIAHRDEARRQLGAPGRVARLWVAMVGLGSQAGVYLASRV